MKYLALLLVLIFACLSLSGCVVYTEKRSESLSQAVFAASDSIAGARFDLALEYSKQAERLAYPPKQRIKISSVFTSSNKVETVSSEKKPILLQRPELKMTDNSSVLRLVIPEKLKHAKLLIENSDEWNELIQTKKFSEQLQQDHKDLQKLTDDISVELQKQTQMNNKMVNDLNLMQKKLVEKDLAILKRNIIIVLLCLTIGGGVYLRIKGIL